MTITLRSTKGSALTFAELDGNFTDLDTRVAALQVYADNILTAVELQQLQTIGNTTISAAQWGYVGSANQALTTTDSPTFAAATITGKITNATAPTVGSDLANKTYVDNQVASADTPIAVSDEGTQLTADVTSFNFTGTYIAASNVGSAVTVDVTLPDSSASDTGLMTAAQFTKLDGIATGAEVNVQSDWNAASGDAHILNKPTVLDAQPIAITDAPTFQSGTLSKSTADGPVLTFNKPATQSADDSVIALLDFNSRDSGANDVRYVRLRAEADAFSSTDRHGSFEVYVINDGVESRVAGFGGRGIGTGVEFNGKIIGFQDLNVQGGNIELGSTGLIHMSGSLNSLTLVGGNTATDGAALKLSAGLNASTARDWEFLDNGNKVFGYDASTLDLDFTGKDITNVHQLYGQSLRIALFSGPTVDNVSPSSFEIRSNVGLAPFRNAIRFRAPNPAVPSSTVVVLDWSYVNQYWNYQNTQIVNVGSLALSASTELTIAAGAVTVTRGLHTLDTEADAATDTLTNISGTSGERVIFRLENAARVVTITNAGNIKLAGGTFTFASVNDTIEFLNDNGTYKEMGRSVNT